MYLMLSEFKL